MGNCAVIDHIINSYTDIDKIYITLGFEGDRVREYIEHVGYENVEFIEIENWQTNQIASFQQYRNMCLTNLYYNACDNWTQNYVQGSNIYIYRKSDASELYDMDGDKVYSGIAYIPRQSKYYSILQLPATITRNDLLLQPTVDQLSACELEDWHDVGNSAS